MEAEERAGGANGDGLGSRSLLVLYGTETGNSQEIAQEIGRAAERLRFQTDIEEMNDVPLVSPTIFRPAPKETWRPLEALTRDSFTAERTGPVPPCDIRHIYNRPRGCAS